MEGLQNRNASFFFTENEGSAIFRNVCKCWPIYPT